MTTVQRRWMQFAAAAILAVPAVLVGTATGSTATPAPPPVCPPVRAPVQVASADNVSFEGAVVDPQGRLYVTDLGGGRILRFDKPGAPFTVIATLPAGGGALAFLPDGTLIVGYGADIRAIFGDTFRPGVIAKVNVDTGALTTIASGFSAADGLAVAHDGTIYATNDFGRYIGRVTPDGRVDTQWATFTPGANGAVLSKDDKYLYFSRTFSYTGVSRLPVDHPDKPESLLDFTGTEIFAAPDGLTLDSEGRPVVPTDVSGEILRIERPQVTCTLATDLPSSSVIVYGHGKTGFAAGHLYRAGFDGKVYEIPAGFDPAAAAAG